MKIPPTDCKTLNGPFGSRPGTLTSVLSLFSNCPMLWALTDTEELRNDVRFALRFKVGRKQQPLTDVERNMVAAAIVEHIRLCNWKVERGPAWGGFAELGRGDDK